MLVTVLAIREIAPTLYIYLRARDIVLLNVTSHTIRACLGPFVSNMKINEVVLRVSLHAIMQTHECLIPQLNKRVVHGAKVIYKGNRIITQKINETEDSRAIVFKLISMNSYMHLRYLYVLDGLAKYVIVVGGLPTSVRIDIYTTYKCVHICDMLEFIARDLWSSDHILSEDTSLKDIVQACNGTSFNYAQVTLESTWFLQHMTRLMM